MGLHVSKANVKKTRSNPAQVDSSAPGTEMLAVQGTGASMMLITRQPGYHSLPHIHAREQYNYHVSGETWLFIEDKGFLCKAGDFTRVPPNAVHWAYNTSKEPSVWLEVHIPGHWGQADVEGVCTPLLAEGETLPSDYNAPRNFFLDQKVYRRAEIEAAVFAEAEKKRGR